MYEVLLLTKGSDSVNGLVGTELTSVIRKDTKKLKMHFYFVRMSRILCVILLSFEAHCTSTTRMPCRPFRWKQLSGKEVHRPDDNSSILRYTAPAHSGHLNAASKPFLAC